MRIRDLPNPFSITLEQDYGTPLDVMGCPVERFTIVMEDANHTTRRGNGKLIITNAPMGHLLYHFSEYDLAHSDDRVVSIILDDMNGSVTVFGFSEGYH